MAATTYRIPLKHGALCITSGSVTHFGIGSHWPAGHVAIVNAANTGGIYGGGVDGAICTAGGDNLSRDRHAIPIVPGTRSTRIPFGSAVATGPGKYGALYGSYVIHAVGPDYQTLLGRSSSTVEADKLLRSAYSQAMQRAAECGIRYLGFSLLSSGIYRGRCSLKHVLSIAVESVTDNCYQGLEEVHLIAFTPTEMSVLLGLVGDLGHQHPARSTHHHHSAQARSHHGADAHHKEPPLQAHDLPIIGRAQSTGSEVHAQSLKEGRIASATLGMDMSETMVPLPHKQLAPLDSSHAVLGGAQCTEGTKEIKMTTSVTSELGGAQITPGQVHADGQKEVKITTSVTPEMTSELGRAQMTGGQVHVEGLKEVKMTKSATPQMNLSEATVSVRCLAPAHQQSGAGAHHEQLAP